MPPVTRETSASPPEQALHKRLIALTRANEIRTKRAQLARDLKAGRVGIEELLIDPPEYLETVKVFPLLLLLPGVGRVTANRLLTYARVSPSKTVGGLSPRQRTEIVTALARQTTRRTGPRKEPVRSKATSADVFLDELKRLIGEREPKLETLRRAARIVAAEESWREGLGLLLSTEEVAELLGVNPRKLAEWRRDGTLIALSSRSGAIRYPAFQFQNGAPSPALAEAHRLLVDKGRISPWSAASWVRSGHHELGGQSPAQWMGEHREERQLLLAAERDANRLSQ
jgi:helix-turn-helix protein/S13-like protein